MKRLLKEIFRQLKYYKKFYWNLATHLCEIIFIVGIVGNYDIRFFCSVYCIYCKYNDIGIEKFLEKFLDNFIEKCEYYLLNIFQIIAITIIAIKK